MHDRPFASTSSFFLIVWFLAAAVVISLLLTLSSPIIAAQPADQSSSSGPPDTTATSRDSLYAEINRGFEALQPVFVKGCFDCHTDRTRFPWYHKLPLIRSLIDSDIRGARKYLEMSSGFPFSRRGSVADDLVNVREELQSGDMPPMLYRLMHWDAKPSQAEADSVYNWINHSLTALSAHGIVPTNPPGEETP